MYGPFGLLSQYQNPVWNDPYKMDPSRMPFGLLAQPQMAQQPPQMPVPQGDMPAPGAVETGPMPQQQPGAPMQLPSANGGPPGQPQDNRGFLEKVGGLLGGIYGQGGPGDNLINMGLALASPGNAAQNLQRANMMNAQQQTMRQRQGAEAMKLQGQNQTAQLLSQRLGITPEQAMGIIQTGGANQLLTQAFQSPDQYKTERDDKGATWQVNTKTGQRSLLQDAEKPQLVDMPTENGNQKAWVAPGSPTGTLVGTPAKTAAVDADTLAKERAKAQVKNEQDAENKTKAADTVMPFIDRAEAAYKKLADLKAIGPISASGGSRMIGGVFGTEAEKARQDFEAAAKELELMKAQISMKGQGQITESERRILQLTLPRLDAADAATGLETLRMMREQFRKNAGQPQQPQQPQQQPKRLRYNPQTGNLE